MIDKILIEDTITRIREKQSDIDLLIGELIGLTGNGDICDNTCTKCRTKNR